MTSTNSDEAKSVSHTTDSELQRHREEIKNFIYPSMPKRNPSLYDKNQQNIKIATNLFELKYLDIFHNLTLFKIETEPLFDENNWYLRRDFYRSIEANLPKSFKKKFFSGKTLFAFISFDNEIKKNFYNKIEINSEIKGKEYSIILTKIKEVEFKKVNDFSGENQKIKLYIETIIRNIVMKNPKVVYFKDRSIFEINLENITKITSDNNESIFRGYMTSAHITESGLCVLINNVNKVISGKTVLEKMNEIKKLNEKFSPSDIKQKIKDYFQNHKTVLTTYGVPKAYRIKNIDFDKTPKNCDITIIDNRLRNNNKRTITLSNYYKTKYHKDINESQPLIEAEPKKKKKFSDQKKNDNNEEQYIIYLVPELLYITGIDDDNINKRQRERNLKNKTKMNPVEKMELINGFKSLYYSTNSKSTQALKFQSPEELAKEWGIQLGNNLTFNGRILLPPVLNFYKKEIQIKNGLFMPGPPSRIKENITEKNFFVLYDFYDKKMNAKKLFDFLSKKFNQKGFNEFNTNKVPGFALKDTSKWETIERELRTFPIYGKDIIFGILFCSDNMEKYYEQFKEYFVKKCNIPTQHLVTRNMKEKERDLNSILFNIVDQINIKIGGMNYYIDFKKEEVIGEKDKLLVIGLDSKTSKDLITYSMTSSIHPKLNLCITQEKTVKKKIKEEKKGALSKMFENAIKKLSISPDYIILYRQGGNEYYNKCLAVDELDIFKEVLNTLREKNKQNTDCNYNNTKFYYICTNLKSDLKFFEESQIEPKYLNPKSGLVVDDYVTQKNKFEFYLQPQFVNQGTATPSHYQVMYYDENDNTLNMENLQKLTFFLTYYYWTWHGAIRIPAVLKFSTTALDFYTRCLNPTKQIEEFEFKHPYFI